MTYTYENLIKITDFLPKKLLTSVYLGSIRFYPPASKVLVYKTMYGFPENYTKCSLSSPLH